MMRDYRFDALMWTICLAFVVLMVSPWVAWRGLVLIWRGLAIVIADWYMPALIILAVVLASEYYP